MSEIEENYSLSNGVLIPKIGLGTWFIKENTVVETIKFAAKRGYRLFDTSQAYGNESGVGEGICTCGVPREELFVTSKIVAEVKTYQGAVQALDSILGKTGLDYMDLIVIHAPQPWSMWRHPNKRFFDENKAVWKAMEEAYCAGKVRSIGVSNFLNDDVENLIKDCRIKPMVNQILCHIGNTPWNLIEYCKKEGILVKSYASLAHMVLGGLAGGAWAGSKGVRFLVTGAPSFLMPLSFVGNGNSNFINGTISILLAFTVSSVFTYFIGFKTGTAALLKENDEAINDENKKLTASTEGAYIELSEVPDETFSSGLMGKGWGFKPSKGEVIAPISGTISSIALSKHAIGITSQNGLELIVHIGMDTVSLNGEGFKVRVKEGDKVNRGELLMKFDLKLLKSENIETTSVMVITNSEQFKIIEKSTHNTIKAGDEIGKFDIIE